MKVKKEEGFQPIVITLETQDEVDALWAISNFTPITEACEGSVVTDIYKCLYPYATKNYDKWHTALDDKYRKAQ